jgi:carboxyl-terminal processing protease
LIDGTGYLIIPSFRLGVIEEIKEACESFQSHAVDSAIIDLRGNTSGDLEEAIHSADLFLSGGKLLSLKTKASSVDYTADDFAYSFDLKLLCDESTGRVAEAFALALKERGAAEVIGRTTLGLGTVQKMITLDDGSILDISYAQFVGPNNTEVQGHGVEPDVEVERTDSGVQDNILKAALDRVRNEKLREAA